MIILPRRSGRTQGNAEGKGFFPPAGRSVLLRHSLHILQGRCRCDFRHLAAAEVFGASDHRPVCDSDGHRYGHRYIRPTRRGTPYNSHVEPSRRTLTQNSHAELSRTPSLQNRARRSRAASLKRTPTSWTTATGRTHRSECRSKLARSLCPTRPQVTICNRLVLPNQAALKLIQHQGDTSDTVADCDCCCCCCCCCCCVLFLELYRDVCAGEWSGYTASRFESRAYEAGDCRKVFDPTCMQKLW
jgi:hypothetical protein